EIARGLERTEHCHKIAGDRDLADRVAAAPILDPETGCAAAIVASDLIDAHADELGYVEALDDVGDELRGRARPGLEVEIRGAGVWRRGHAGLRMAGGRKIELARSCAIEEPGLERPVINDGEHASRHALRIEGARALPALAQRIVDDADAG